MALIVYWIKSRAHDCAREVCLFEIIPERKNSINKRFMRELIDRQKAAMKLLPRRAARVTLDAVKKGIPPEKEWDAYRHSLDVYELAGTGKIYEVGVVSRPEKTQLKVIDTYSTVLYIQPRGRGSEISEAALLLQRYEPWSHSTLPYEPSPKEAEVIARRVSPREVKAVESRLKSVTGSIERELARLGVRLRKLPRTALGRKVKMDLAFMALRLEFGFAGFPHTPHWRPILRRIVKNPRLTLTNKIERTMTDPKYGGWKGQHILPEMPESLVDNFNEFQSRISV